MYLLFFGYLMLLSFSLKVIFFVSVRKFTFILKKLFSYFNPSIVDHEDPQKPSSDGFNNHLKYFLALVKVEG